MLNFLSLQQSDISLSDAGLETNLVKKYIYKFETAWRLFDSEDKEEKENRRVKKQCIYSTI